jgi:hypothetical protein
MTKLFKYLFVCFSIGGYSRMKFFSCGLRMINLFLPNLKICLFLNGCKPPMNEKTANPKRLMTFKQTGCLRNGGGLNRCFTDIYISNCLVYKIIF